MATGGLEKISGGAFILVFLKSRVEQKQRGGSMNKSLNRLMNRSMNKLVNRSRNRSRNRSMNKSLNRSRNRSRNSLLNKLMNYEIFRVTNVLFLVIACVLASSGCKDCKKEDQKKRSEKEGPAGLKSDPKKTVIGDEKETTGLVFELTDEKAGAAGSYEPIPRADAVPLAMADTKKLLRRLSPLKVSEGDKKAFAFRAASLPAPRAAAIKKESFPPKEELKPPKESVDKGPLKIVRYSPEGDVDMAPRLSVTFSQPMVSVTSHAATTAKGVPVEIRPEIEGKWRWVGAKTLFFEAKKRLPMATRFHVSVPAGTKSVTGGELEKTKEWSFQTPPPTVLAGHPRGGPHSVDPVFVLVFDQEIEPEKVLKKVGLRGGGAVALRMATQSEITGDEIAAAFVEGAPEKRVLAFVAQNKLESDTSYQVVVDEGTPSKEGPLVTKETQVLDFKTYSPLAVSSKNCEPSFKCRPFHPMYFRFNNRLDEESVQAKDVKVSPSLPDMDISVRGHSLIVRGQTKGRTDYHVTLPPTLKDAFGQTLGRSLGRTFHFREAVPNLTSGYGTFAVLDPSGDKSFRVSSVNFEKLKVKVYKVGPKDWDAYMNYSGKYRWSKDPVSPPGKLIEEKVIKVEKGADEMVETAISLKNYLNEQGHGQLMVQVSQWPLPEKKYERKYVLSWVQVTDLALDAFADHGKMIAWVSRLRDGKPVSGATLSLEPVSSIISARSTETGIAKLDLPISTDGHAVLVARKGEDLAILPETLYRRRTGRWTKSSGPGKVVGWYVFDDRNLYRPKEEVRVKGWARVVDMSAEAGVELLPERAREVRFTVYGPRGNKIGEGSAPVDDSGGFDLKFNLPDDVNLGRARVSLSLAGVAFQRSVYSHFFKIQEFKRPEFEVKTEASQGPHFVGGEVDFTTSAEYFSGGGLANAPVKWRVFAKRGSFRPPNRDEYTFVGWTPSWLKGRSRDSMTTKTHESRTDSRGEDSLKVLLKKLKPSQPMSLTASVTVTDVDRRTWTSEKSVLVHPATRYVGIKTDRYFVRKGTPLKVDAIVTNLEGEAQKDVEVLIKAYRHKWRYEKGKWITRKVDPQECKVRSAGDAVQCKFGTKEGGRYSIEAIVHDDKGRSNTTVLTRWVSGGRRPPSRKVEREKVRLIADKESYEPGETAEVLVQAPFEGAEGLLTIRRAGIVKKERFAIIGNTKTLKIPISEKAIPGLRVHVDLVGAAVRIDDKGEPVKSLPKRPAFASGSLILKVPAHKKRLKVDVEPRKKRLSPGGKTTIAVNVKDSVGNAVNKGRVAVVVVDEAVLALTGYSLGDPIAPFFPLRSEGVSDHHLRRAVALMDPQKLSKFKDVDVSMPAGRKDMATLRAALPESSAKRSRKRMPRRAVAMKSESMAEEASEPEGTPIAVRKDFSALALFVPAAEIGSGGRVEIPLQLPDSLTRYRVFAVAVSGADMYGKGESNVTAGMPLMVRPKAPRFLNYGDRFQLPVVVHNATEEEMYVDVAVRAGNLRLAQNPGKRIKVPAEDRREVLFEAETIMSGKARVQVAATSGAASDAAQVSLPVWTPATTEAFATYGTIDDKGEVQPVKVPPDVIPVFGGLEINTSSTALSALTDAVIYLYEYPFGCAEQLASRILSATALRDVLSAFKAKGLPSEGAMEEMLKRDMERLRSIQNHDGGFGFWRSGRRSWPFISVHVTHAILRAKQKGYDVPQNMLQRAIAYVETIESHIPGEYSERARWVITAYGKYVSALADKPDPAGAEKAFKKLTAMRPIPMEGIAWLYPVFVKSKDTESIERIRKLLRNRVTETASAAHFRTSYEDGAHLVLHSSRRIDGIILEGLIKDQPKSDLIVKIVRSLLAHRKRGRWSNTQENAWVLLGLDQYFRTYEKDTPAFTARIWLGESFAGSQNFRGRTTEEKLIEIPMSQLSKITEGEAKDLVVDKKGRGRLYYRIGMRYAPKDLRPPPVNHGFTVQRRYEAVDDPKDVTREPDGSWSVRAGARVKVVVTMAAHERRTHVALVDPLPAGLEAINASLKGAERKPDKDKQNTGLKKTGLRYSHRRGRRHRGRVRGTAGLLRAQHFYRYLWRLKWYEHQNLRDERAEAFTSLLPAGVYTYEYTARALTPGRFIAPPPKAEEMYHPETFGRGKGDILVIR